MIWWLFLAVRYTLGSLFLAPLAFLNKKVRERRRQEKELGPTSLKEVAYPYWFHVSSEGELEQVLPLVNALEARLSSENLYSEKGSDRLVKKEILLLYTSPSLTKKMASLSQEYQFVEVAMVPLLKIFPWGKGSLFHLKAPQLFFMVRYDFFPELLLVGNHVTKSDDGRFILLSASLKGKDRSFKRNRLKKLYYHFILSSFKEVYAAGPPDLKRIESFYKGEAPFSLFEHDFRHGQIIDRQRAQTNFKNTHCLDSFKKWLEGVELQERIIFGSLWFGELSVFNEEFKEALKRGELRVFLAPHKLSGSEWDRIEKALESWQKEGIGVVKWSQYGIQGEGSVLLCQVPGLLCELYPFFGHNFIGGGHGRSIHSLLEPFWGGGHIYCGPKTHRSTEFDFVQEHSPRHLHVVNELEDFYPLYKKEKDTPLDMAAREKSRERVMEKQLEIIDHFIKGPSYQKN